MGLASLPPKYANVSMAALLAEISDGAFRDYARMRAMAWGGDYLEFSAEDYVEAWGISIQTFYRRLSELQTNGVLRYTSTCNSITRHRTFKIEFAILKYENETVENGDLILKIENGEADESAPILKYENDEAEESAPILKYENENDNSTPKSPSKSHSQIWECPSSSSSLTITDHLEREEEESAAILKFENDETPEMLAMRVFTGITQMIAMPGNGTRAAAVQVIVAYVGEHGGEQGAIEALMPFWQAWKGYRTADGRFANKTNLAWLTDWAATGEIPQSVQARQGQAAKKQAESGTIAARRAAAAQLLEVQNG